MGNLTKILGKDFKDSEKYYSKIMKLVYNGKKINSTSTTGVDFYQLYAVGSIITNNTKYDLSGTTADIVWFFLNGPAEEHAFDIVDTEHQRRIIIAGTGSNTVFRMYYINNSTVYKYEFSTGYSLGISLINLKINLTNGNVIDKANIFAHNTKFEQVVSVVDVTSNPDTPPSYKTFDGLKYGIRIQGDVDGRVIPSTDLRFRGARVSVDDVDVACVQCTPPDLYEWVSNTFFRYSASTHVASLVGDSTKSEIYNILSLSNAE